MLEKIEMKFYNRRFLRNMLCGNEIAGWDSP